VYTPALPFLFYFRENEKRKSKCFVPFFVFNVIKSEVKKSKTISHTVYRFFRQSNKIRNAKIGFIQRNGTSFFISRYEQWKTVGYTVNRLPYLKRKKRKTKGAAVGSGEITATFRTLFSPFETKISYHVSPPWTPLMPVCYGFARLSYGGNTVHARRATVMSRNKPALFRSPVSPGRPFIAKTFWTIFSIFNKIVRPNKNMSGSCDTPQK